MLLKCAQKLILLLKSMQEAIYIGKNELIDMNHFIFLCACYVDASIIGEKVIDIADMAMLLIYFNGKKRKINPQEALSDRRIQIRAIEVRLELKRREWALHIENIPS